MPNDPRDGPASQTTLRHRALRQAAASARDRAVVIAAQSREQAQRSLVTAERARALMERTRARWIVRHPRENDGHQG